MVQKERKSTSTTRLDYQVFEHSKKQNLNNLPTPGSIGCYYMAKKASVIFVLTDGLTLTKAQWSASSGAGTSKRHQAADANVLAEATRG